MCVIDSTSSPMEVLHNESAATPDTKRILESCEVVTQSKLIQVISPFDPRRQKHLWRPYLKTKTQQIRISEHESIIIVHQFVCVCNNCYLTTSKLSNNSHDCT